MTAFISEQAENQEMQKVLSVLSELEILRNKDIEDLRQQIEAVKNKHSEVANPHIERLDAIVQQLVLESYGVKVGDVVEVKHGYRTKQTRTHRIDAIVARPRFFNWKGEITNACDFEIIGTHIKKDGKDGDHNVRISESRIVKAVTATT